MHVANACFKVDVINCMLESAYLYVHIIKCVFQSAYFKVHVKSLCHEVHIAYHIIQGDNCRL